MSNITITTEITKNDKRVDGLAVRFDLSELNKIIKSSGVEQANVELDKFIGKYTADLKKKVSSALKS